MERLTEPCWKNLDPWECCGQDYFCKRGCHEEGGCTNGCIVPKIYVRLAAYEDTGLTPEEIKAPFTEDTMINLAAQALGVEADRLRELAEADKDGRVVVLPCKGYSSIDIARDGVSYRPDHWNIYLTAYAHGQNTPSGLKVGLFDIGEVERAMEGKT